MSLRLLKQLILRKAFVLFSLSLFLSISLFAQPSNDNCTNAITLTSNTSCNNVQYRLKNATQSMGAGGFGCAVAGNYYDVWFTFTAVSTTHTVTISNLQSNFTNPSIQLIGGTCAVPVSIACGTTTVTSAALTIGTVYYVRVSNFGAAISSNDRFDICLTHPPVPANDNCSGATTLASTATPTCTGVAGTLYNANNSGTAGTCTGASPTYEVWYKFTATSTTHAVTVSGLGSSLTAATTYMQLLSGACGAPVNIACQTVATTGGRITSTTLTVGAIYYVRVYTITSPNTGASANWSFSICLQNPPVNDLCANATVLTPGATCVTTAGTLDLAIPTVLAAPFGCAVAGTYYDVWYRFTAAALSQTITISGIGSGITAPTIRIYNACGGAPFGCASAVTLTQAGLVIGTQYWVSISNFNANPSGTGGVGNFNICITNVVTPPGNDNCSGAILLTSGTNCSNTSGTIINATATAGLAACGNALSPEVWYRFVAQSAFPTITLSSVGANLAAANPRIQLFSGACGSLTALSVPCVASPLNVGTNPGGAGLTIGATYYIRITTTALAAPVAAGTYTFNICITDPTPLAITIIDYAKSYVNITSGTVGGTINPGDELEIRATLTIRNPAITIDSIAYYDTLRAGKGFMLKANSIATRTNEGKIFQSFTDASGDADAGWYTTAGAGSDTAIQMNLGPTATRTARGALSNTSKPSLFTTTCITMATYRVIVNAAYGTKINYGGGAFTYRNQATGSSIRIDFPYDSLMIFQNVGICPNTIAQTNILGDEFNGTFGTAAASAGSQNRGTSANTSYSYQAFNPSGPNDYFYGVPNNTSANFTTVQTVVKPGGAPRVFGHWDITGDHTGAIDPIHGNKPCNPLLPISATNPCGYMLVVNAAYRTDVAFSFSVSGVCPNTYYEISTWIKNICYKCGCDVNGKQSSDASGPPFYIPTAPGDSSGVRPNLAYEIDGVDYYTTGDIVYQGLGGTQTGSDTLNKWVQKAFVYRTGPTQTGFALTIRNNAPGGGGNDWALDDISLRTCYPSMSYSPSITPNVCVNSTITITDTVRSFYNTYVEYKWQRSTDGGNTWVDIAGTTATATPVVVNGMFQFVTSYTIPLPFTTLANNGDQYRVVVATTVANLASTCNYSDVIPITITVSQPSVDPSSVTGADICNPGSTTLTAVGGTLGASANYQWGTGAVVGTNPIIGATSSTLTVSPIVTTTYWVRIENTTAPCPPTTSGITKTITVSQPSIAATSAAKDKNNICPGISVNLSIVGGTLGTGATWKWYTGACGTTLVGSGAGLSVTPLVTTTYYVRAEGACNTTTCQAVTVTISCDIDKDKDGIPDWVESNIAAAFQDANANGLINAYDPTYPGFVDNNNDYINDNFQADGDSDNDGLPNYLDLDFPGRVDINSDGIDDRFDTDLDGKINMIDLDSDNDGVPDVVEAYGVDTNGDAKIDNFVDADGDGLSDQVDANLVNAYNSGVGLGKPDLDVDGVPNYLDLDSDNDGIPDIVEVGAPDTDNNGKVDGFTDANGDGLHDGYINATALLMTGTDINGDGKADSYPNKNMDRDFRPNAYDLDSDGDGIVDVIEAGLPDLNLNGIVDGIIGLNGWSTTVSGMAALNLRFTDADGKPDYLDIDSDDDGIPDNIEGQTTLGYKLPTLIDADGDGLMNPYDNLPAAFGGAGIFVYDHDADGTPDYRDLDTDADGQPDIIEGNDFNLNGIADDNVTLTGLDTDGDGLDNRFDSLNSVTNIKGTSYRMGTGGTFTGDAAPGSRCTVQKKFPAQTDRDWRYVGVVLPVEILSFTGLLNNNNVLLNWTIIAEKEIDRFEIERSTTNSNFIKIKTVAGTAVLQTQQNFSATDDVTDVNSEIIYYRLKVIGTDGAVKYSNVIFVRKKQNQVYVSIMPNPANSYVKISLDVDANMNATVVLIDYLGRRILVQDEKLTKGFNTLTLTLDRYSAGVYAIVIETASDKIIKQMIIVR